MYTLEALIFAALMVITGSGVVLSGNSDECMDDLSAATARIIELETLLETTELRASILSDKVSRLQTTLNDLNETHRTIGIVALAAIFLLATSYLVVVFSRAVRSLLGGVADYVAVSAGYRIPPRDVELQTLIPRQQQSPSNPITVTADVHPQHVLESSVPGSNYKVTENYPKCQFQIEIETIDGSSCVGQGFRLDDFLVTAGHVVSQLILKGYESITLTTMSGSVLVPVSAFEICEGADMAYLAFSQVGHQRLSLQKAKIVDKKFSYTRLVSRAYTLQSFTEGSITPQGKGQLYYEGSSRLGFSGAPYMWNTSVIAMHQGSYRVGYGIDVHLMKSFLPKWTAEGGDFMTGDRIAREIVEDYFTKGHHPEFYQTPGEIRFLHKGEYKVVDSDQMTDELWDVINYCEGKGTKPFRIQESNVPSLNQVVLESNKKLSEKLLESNMILADVLSEKIETTTRSSDLAVQQLGEALKDLKVRHIDAPAPSTTKNLNIPHLAGEVVVQDHGRSTLVTDAQRLEKMTSSLQSRISKLENQLRSDGRPLTRAQPNAALPSTVRST